MVRSREKAWWVGVAFLLLVNCTRASEMMYAMGDNGMCSGLLKTLPTRTNTYCAMACSANSACNAFYYQYEKCSLYLHVVEPGSTNVNCYVPTVALSASPNDLTTSPPPTTQPSTSLSTTTTSIGSPMLDWSGVNELGVNFLSRCSINGGIIGIFVESDKYNFLCRSSLNEIPLSVADPAPFCAGTEIECLTTTCDADKIFIGYDQNGPKGPCYTISSQQATVDKADCYTETSPGPLPDGKGSSWTQWRVCRTDAFFVVVAADVTGGMIASVTCCRAKVV